MKKSFIFILLSNIVLSSCTEDPPLSVSELSPSATYLHLAHTRTDANPYMDSIVESIDYSALNMLWLGGDLAWSSSISDEVINHADSIFDFGNLNTLWALGNHDYFDLNRIEAATGRPPFYAYYKNGITFLVLDTQDSVSSITSEQLALLSNIKDTIRSSSHLILLHHKLLWMRGNPDLEPLIDSISNGPAGECDWCINPNNFYHDVYPLLLDVKRNGIEVLCIAGDIGDKVSEFQHLTDDGIFLLASGINAGFTGNKALLFKHNIRAKSLSWKYQLLTHFLAQ
jgi:hypothetical protein